MMLTRLATPQATEEMKYEVLKAIGVTVKEFRKLTYAEKNDLFFKCIYDQLNPPSTVTKVMQRSVVIEERVYDCVSVMDVDTSYGGTENKKRKR